MTTPTATKKISARKGFVIASDAGFDYNDEQNAWLQRSYKMIIKILKKQDTLHVDDFWKAMKEDTFPVSESIRDSRILGAVFRQIAREGHMSNTGYAKRVTHTKANYYRPVWSSNLRVAKV